MSLRWNGSTLGALRLPTPASASGCWSLRSQAAYKRDYRWPVALPVTANLILWVDAADPRSVFVNGSSVVAITDKSSSPKQITQITAARQPAYVANAKNGLGFLRFTGSSLHFLNLSSTTIPASHTTFIVWQRSSSGVNSLGLGGGSVDNYAHLRFTDNVLYQRSNASNNTAHGTASTATGWFYVTTRRNGTTQIRMRQNGTTVADVTTGTGVTNAASGSWTAIGNAFSTGYMTGDIGEIIAYDTNLSDSDIDLVESYLATKWAI